MAYDDELMGQLAAQDAPDYDVFARAAQRVRAPYSKPVEGPGIGGGIGQLAEPLVSQPSWLERAAAQSAKNQAAFKMGGVAGLMADTSVGQELAGGFGGVTKAVGKPVMGALAEAAAPPFYSAAQRAVEGAKLGKGTPEQWLGYLRNQPGVKGEEIDRVFGNLPKEGMLTKADMQAHAAENAVTLGEVNKSNIVEAPGFGTAQEQAAAIRRYEEAHRAIINGPVGTPEYQLAVQEFTDAQAAIRDTVPGWGRSAGTIQNPAKYDQWQLPGGENYREKLLTLPSEMPETAKATINNYNVLNRRMADQMAEWKGLAEARPPGDPETLAAYQRLAATRREANAAEDAATKIKQQYQSSTFRSSHWDEPNVLAHIRMNDRGVPGVGKSLHLEEIQSDWHQKGRTQGYKDDVAVEAARKEYNERTAERDALIRKYNDHDNLVAARQQMTPEDRAIEQQLSQRIVELGSVRTDGVPDAPFKSTWPDVALKRSIREAAEGGYDALSWTPGEAQAARYDLSKQVNQLDLTHNRDGIGKLGMTLKDGSRQYVDITSRENLADTVGKDVAEKLYKQGAENNGVAVLSGLDLKIGGEGMKAFYDKMLVDKANALGKKHGARVEQQELAPQPVQQGLMKQFDYDAVKNGAPVHVLRITPQLRAAAMKGFPLFTAAGGVMGGLAAQDNYE